MSIHFQLRQRESGNLSRLLCSCYARSLVENDVLLLKKKLWSNLWPKVDHRPFSNSLEHSYANHKGIFGLKYSNDGKFLVAACENNRLVVIDPLTYKTICMKDNVHKKRCNIITFIDNRLFATCSDDETVSIWDIRNMNKSVMRLKGHTCWVKNVEFHKSSQLLVSSGFDDQVISWNLNKSYDGGCQSKNVLKCPGLRRMRISPDGNSMYLTLDDHADLVAVHNLNLDTLYEDVGNLTAALYRQHFSSEMYPYRYNRDDVCESNAASFSRRNHVDFYFAYNGGIMTEIKDTFVACNSLDVHPENSAVVMKYERYPWDGTKCLSVHNTWSYYDGPFCGINNRTIKDDNWLQNPRNTYLPLERGQPTNYVHDHESDDGKYIQEVAFSPCGSLIASPSSYGVRILSYDKRITDYRTHIATRVNSMYRLDDGDTVLPKYVVLDPKPLNTVKFCFGHSNLVLCACFSPTHMQLASGSREGQILLHEVAF